MRVVLAALLLAGGCAPWFLSLEGHPRTMPWAATCRDAFALARDEITRADPQLSDGYVLVLVDRVQEADDCEAATGPVSLDSTHYSAQVHPDDGIVSQPWRREGAKWFRNEPGREGEVDADSAGEVAADILRDAVETCLAVMPAGRPTVTPPPTLLPDADEAAWQIERSCRVDVARAHALLARVTAIGFAATPTLLRLARSRNPAVRAIAAIGLGDARSEAGRQALLRLREDFEFVERLYGDAIEFEPVAKLAIESLARY